MIKIFLYIVGIKLFLIAADLYAEYLGHKDEQQYRKDYFETTGKRLKRKPPTPKGE